MARESRPVTLRGIADELGLHISTVSRVLNGPSGERGRAASGETARRIREVADRLGYRPDPYATSLRTRRSNLVGVLVPRLSEIVMATVYEGVEEEATAHGLSTFVTNTHDEPAVQRERIAMVLGRRVDGLIIGDAHLDGDVLEDPALRGTPVVLVNRRDGRGALPSVTCDDVAGGRLVAEHFLALGHREVAVIAGEPFASTGVDRTAGFTERYREAGLPVPAHRIRRSGFDTAGGRAAATALLAGPDRPTAVFAVNDFAAIGAAGAARDLGLRLGEDVAIAGFNDTPLAAELPVALTSVRSPSAELGRLAVRRLVALIAGEEGTAGDAQRLQPTLMARASTGTPVGPPLG